MIIPFNLVFTAGQGFTRRLRRNSGYHDHAYVSFFSNVGHDYYLRNMQLCVCVCVCVCAMPHLGIDSDNTCRMKIISRTNFL